MLEDDRHTVEDRQPDSKVGYKNPPLHSRFKPGQSGNPSGRPKGCLNFNTLFDRILREEVSLREGNAVRKFSRAEAVLRSLVVGAIKGDTRNMATLFRLAEQTGQIQSNREGTDQVQRVIVQWMSNDQDGKSKVVWPSDKEPQGS